MTTNPTPLTAEAIVRKWISFTYRTHWLQGFISDIEAYAAQQNAELVAENSRLMNESMDTRIKIDSLLFTNKNLQAENEQLKTDIKLLDEQGNRLAAALQDKQIENERLKQQLADVENVCKPHKRMGAGGCDAMSEGRRQAKSELAKQVLAIIQPPKEASND